MTLCCNNIGLARRPGFADSFSSLLHGCILLLAHILPTSTFFSQASGSYGCPPSIVRGPAAWIVLRVDEPIDLTCEATGSPTPEYEWRKNGEMLDMNWSDLERKSHGSVRIRSASALDVGYYQCFAINSHGTAVSNVSHVSRALLQSFLPTDIQYHVVRQGDPFRLYCNAPRCRPTAVYSWAVAVDKLVWPENLLMDKRIQMDVHGNLHFAYTTLSDNQAGRMYKCNVFNRYLDSIVSGSYAKINVTARDIRPRPPNVLFHQVSIALEDHSTVLKCFFAGYPVPSITWNRVDGNLPLGRHTIQNFNTELQLNSVRQSDEGRYVCKGDNTAGHAELTLDLIVNAIPRFESTNNRPHDINVTDGDTVTLNCIAYGKPAVRYMWFQNGLHLQESVLPENMRISRDSRTLIIRDMCRDCSRFSSRPTVIQCNASNEHGYAFANGYINVLARTSIIQAPYDQIFSPNDSVSFDCTAVSDYRTAIIYQWFINDERVEDRFGSDAHTSDNGSLYITWRSDRAASSLIGTYRCHATNGYSHVDATASLSLTDERMLKAFLGWWWILLLLICLLILLLLLICFVVYRNLNRSGTYPVDLKEKQSGKDPAKEAHDDDFNEYRRPDDADFLKGSNGSLVTSSLGGSLNEFGVMDESQFNEDGSFIGLYKKPDSRNYTSASSVGHNNTTLNHQRPVDHSI